MVDSLFNQVVVHPAVTLTPEQALKVFAFRTYVNAMAKELAEIPDSSLLFMPDGNWISGKELKSIWSRVDFQINPDWKVYSNGTVRGEADFNYGDPIVAYNITTFMGYMDSPAEMIYLILHELGHLTQAGRDMNGDLKAGTVTPEYNEQYASSIALAIANATGQPTLDRPEYGYLPSPVSFSPPAGSGGSTGGNSGSGGSTGGSTGDTGGSTGGTGGSTGGNGGSTGGGGSYHEP